MLAARGGTASWARHGAEAEGAPAPCPATTTTTNMTWGLRCTLGTLTLKHDLHAHASPCPWIMVRYAARHQFLPTQ